ncbi:hypothetical protein BN2476_360029 [Paraburkholderia piptadeniae]|uniref:Uncharacterized protein n=1 Tax=Paraburkholderia piptadeniae TaxID=1701573 RepID=A0A1N7S944_9BURK|nr:hypothetical protein BN2476_360029 [Paraburkholderia piptadeniae]
MTVDALPFYGKGKQTLQLLLRSRKKSLQTPYLSSTPGDNDKMKRQDALKCKLNRSTRSSNAPTGLAFLGDVTVYEAYSRGTSGEPSLYACEIGRAVGTASPSPVIWRVADSIRDGHYCRGCDGSCVGQETRRSQRLQK